MRVLENLLNLTGGLVPDYWTGNSTTHPVERKVVGDEQWVRAIPPSPIVRLIVTQIVKAPLPETLTHSVDVNPEIDCNIYDTRDPSKINFCPAGVWTRLSVTLSADSSNHGRGYLITCDDPAFVGKWIRTRKIISVAGDQEPDIWLPPESALTPEQIAMLPPYGEYKEIKAF